ncbi:MAG: hypothetical protein JOZ17_04340 [Acetobacteraceae bacterium]|nr:hypothetical protein [Acetobacteraceae bacterium]
MVRAPSSRAASGLPTQWCCLVAMRKGNACSNACFPCNDLGLLSEEYDVPTKRLIGNFPQAFSHIALINMAHNLARRSKPAEQRAGEA